MREVYLLTGPLEPTNQLYLVANIAGIIQCELYNRQYGRLFLAIMPTNLYGPNDNFDLETSHVLPALIGKFHLAKLIVEGDWETIGGDEKRFGPITDGFRKNLISISKHHDHESLVPSGHSLMPSAKPPKVVLWGTGQPRSEFLHLDDLTHVFLFFMNLLYELIK
jgi:GDP-L-fucose synthase